MNVRPVYLCILDGFALGAKSRGNAVYQAARSGKAPFIADLLSRRPYARLDCSGLAVGLPAGTMGNSEVNHLNMGAGRVVYQSIERINVAIQDGSFFANEALLTAVNRCQQHDATLHLMGILQGGGGTVHGSITHTFALLELAKKAGLKKVAIHLFGDGRDTNPQSLGGTWLPMLESKITELGMRNEVKIVTVMGREIAMDRDTDYNKTLVALKALVRGECESTAPTAAEAVARSYAAGVTDEFIRPVKIGEYTGIAPQDAVVFWNYRQDRGIQLTAAFRETDHKYFNYKKGTRPIDEALYRQIEAVRQPVRDIPFVAMTEYYEGINALTAFPEKEIPGTVGEVVANAGLLQLRLAGTEKFAHVTGWFSGRRGTPFPGEDRILVQDPTLKARTEQGKRYDLVPEMTAFLETEASLKAMADKHYALIVHNFQNGDMVGHTGNLEAATQAIVALSQCLERLVPAWSAKGGSFIITADHGNADEMLLEEKGKEVVSTQHSLNPVPFWVLGGETKLKEQGIIPDVGVTVLDLMGLPAPAAMTAKTLLAR